MKILKYTLLFGLAILSYSAIAQYKTVPQGFMYQAIARDASGFPIKNSLVKIRISIVEDDANGPAVYEEGHEVITNKYGLFTLKVGAGNADSDFQSIDWLNHNYWITTELSSDRGFDIMGTLPILSVPYAIIAQKAIEDEVIDEDANPFNEIQQLSRSGSNIELTRGGGSITLNDDDPENEIQQLSKSGSNIELTRGGGVITLNDDDAVNEIQQLSKSGNIIELTRGGGTITLNDDDANNELQALSRQGNTIILSNGGGSFSDEVNDNDSNPNNELQSLSWDRLTNNLSITNRGATRISSFSSQITITNGSGDTRIWNSVTDNAANVVGLGANAEHNWGLNYLNNAPNNAYIWVTGPGGLGTDNVPDGGIYVNTDGNVEVFGDTKNFKMDHPKDNTKEIWYAAVEGPEAAAYERGTAKLINGEAVITFSEHFQMVINPKTITVNLTPLFTNTYGVAVIEKLANGIKVKELMNGTGNFEFDWEVKGVRRGFENYRVIREKTERAVMIPKQTSNQ